MNGRHLSLLVGALVWFCAILGLAAKGAFVSGPDEPPIAVGVAFLAPLLLFLLGLRISSWRRLVLSISPIFLIALNGWRFIGLGFLTAYQEGLLPGGFAWPAGLGDIAPPPRGLPRAWPLTIDFGSVTNFLSGTCLVSRTSSMRSSSALSTIGLGLHC